ncbi:jg14491 [Pararge aegeria aegeria]|uniref:Jg14491 protein n=1 Tax=Pararge aegeria aegeria TaxID=348720 RepID=A0A8S4RW73_9NEOP|nr:jg14491 [Pararge aegeria aegeria]
MITGHCPLNKHLSILGRTDSPLCRACMETEETPIHVILQCNGVAEQRAAYLGSSATLHEALGNLGGLLSFWNQPSAEKAQEQKKKKGIGKGVSLKDKMRNKEFRRRTKVTDIAQTIRKLNNVQAMLIVGAMAVGSETF